MTEAASGNQFKVEIPDNEPIKPLQASSTIFPCSVCLKVFSTLKTYFN